MTNSKRLKFFRVCILLLLTLWIAFPKTYVHEWLKHRHSAVVKYSGTTVSQKGAADCDFENFSKPLNAFVSELPLFVGDRAYVSLTRVESETGTIFLPLKGKLAPRAPPAKG